MRRALPQIIFAIAFVFAFVGIVRLAEQRDEAIASARAMAAECGRLRLMLDDQGEAQAPIIYTTQRARQGSLVK